MEEVSSTDSGFLATAPTLSASAIGDNSLLQIYPGGLRHIRTTAHAPTNEWKCPGKKVIVTCGVNKRQVVIALTGGELVYFELDPISGDLSGPSRPHSASLSTPRALFNATGQSRVMLSPR